MEALIKNILEDTIKAFDNITHVSGIIKRKYIHILIKTSTLKYQIRIRNPTQRKINLIENILNTPLINSNKTNEKTNDQNVYDNILEFIPEDIYINFFNKYRNPFSTKVSISCKYNQLILDNTIINAKSLKFSHPSIIYIEYLKLFKILSLFQNNRTKIYLNSNDSSVFKFKHYYDKDIILIYEHYYDN